MRRNQKNVDEPSSTDGHDTAAVMECQDEAADGDGSVENDIATESELISLVPERFSVRDAASANWVVGRVTEAERTIEYAKAWLQRIIRRAEREREFFFYRFGPQMEAWAKAELTKLKGRRKSIDLPAGSVGYRTQHSKLVVDDETTVLEWAEQNCQQAVVTVKKLSKTALNEHLAQTGELPEGTHLQPKQDVFFIR